MPQLKKNAPKAAQKKRVHDEMSKFKKKTLKSSSGKKVTKRSQAIAIALSEAGQSKKSRTGGRTRKAKKASGKS